MSLRTAVAVPFRQRGSEQLAESEFVVALSLDRDWFTPDQAKRLVDVAVGEGLLAHEDGDVRPTFDTSEVSVPDGFTPDESLVRQRSAFERTLEALVDAGHEKQEAVANVNALQRNLDISIGAAAVLYARRQGLDVESIAERALAEL